MYSHFSLFVIIENLLHFALSGLCTVIGFNLPKNARPFRLILYRSAQIRLWQSLQIATQNVKKAIFEVQKSISFKHSTSYIFGRKTKLPSRHRSSKFTHTVVSLCCLFIAEIRINIPCKVTNQQKYFQHTYHLLYCMSL